MSLKKEHDGKGGAGLADPRTVGCGEHPQGARAYPECTQGSYRKTGSFLGAKSYSIQESMAPETIRNK